MVYCATIYIVYTVYTVCVYTVCIFSMHIYTYIIIFLLFYHLLPTFVAYCRMACHKNVTVQNAPVLWCDNKTLWLDIKGKCRINLTSFLQLFLLYLSLRSDSSQQITHAQRTETLSLGEIWQPRCDRLHLIRKTSAWRERANAHSGKHTDSLLKILRLLIY